MARNIFDNSTFFAEYMKLRSEKNYNDLLEQPEMSKLLPPVKGRSVLDAGCGFGANCRAFAEMGASRVVGIDISKKMLERAERENSLDVVEYQERDMADISGVSGPFDLVYSSLAFHYVRDFDKLIGDIGRLLVPHGVLLFSQEHPVVTATIDYRGHFDDFGHYVFGDYQAEGKRYGTWFVKDVESYHRTTATILTTVAKNGFRITDVVEPVPSPLALRERPDLEKDFIRPTFLIVKAFKDTY